MYLISLQHGNRGCCKPLLPGAKGILDNWDERSATWNYKVNAGLETNARPLARGELNSVRASGSSDLTSPVGEWEFYGDLSTIS